MCPQTLTTSGIVTFFNYICITHEYNDDVEVGGARYLYGLDFGHELAQIYFFDFWQWDSMLIPPRGVRSQSRGGKLDFLVKEATKNTANTVLDREVNLHIQEN